MTDEMWYKRAIIYELHVRSFCDGNGDGVGDFRGLTGRLDYLQKLGVDALWLLPFYPSPLRDDGYDIADYQNLAPAYGSLAEFKLFLKEAHARGLKVITELVLNHTSDQHPWFQRARRARPGSRWRDFYVWSESPDRFRQARVLFQGVEQSNWAWDPVAKAYYWHRFFAHQPDLNYDHPAVRKALFRVVDFWLGLGVDGLRLDAIPYLFERTGTPCENLPETHEFLRALRKHVDERYPGRMLLAEANQWPEDAVRYFGEGPHGEGDECHMAFHFPLMPRVYLSLMLEDRHPIVDVIEQTPAIPPTAQWATFLRNHDELTLEMVTDEERDVMLRYYAHDVKARIYSGIRRRLAPLMRNDRRKIELLHVMIFSMPGTPVMYYGDEIGMGDNYYLGDRNGVRTPMQWSPDRNAGFSVANPQALALPVVIEPEYHYEVVNVEVQERNPSSLLWWVRRLTNVYKSQPAFGGGRLEFVSSENSKVLALLRGEEDHRVLIAANLSRNAQADRLHLPGFSGLIPVELFGRARFPEIKDDLLPLSFAPYGYYWFRFEPRQPSFKSVTEIGLHELTERQRELAGFFRLESLLLSGKKAAGKPEGMERRLTLLESEPGREAAAQCLSFLEPAPGVSAGGDDPAIRALAGFLSRTRSRRGVRGRFAARAGACALDGPAVLEHGELRAVSASVMAATFALGRKLFLKLYLRPEFGVNPEYETLARLNAVGFAAAPRLYADLRYVKDGGGETHLAVLLEFLDNAAPMDGFILEALQQRFERLLGDQTEQPPPPAPSDSAGGAADPLTAVAVAGQNYVADCFRSLGRALAGLHRTLATPDRGDDPAFTPMPMTKQYLRSVYQGMRNETHLAAHAATAFLDSQGPETGGQSSSKAPLPRKELLNRFARILTLPATGKRIRLHGNAEPSNVLLRGMKPVFIDFGGDSRIPFAERRMKRSPLRDLADLICAVRLLCREFIADPAAPGPEDRAALAPQLVTFAEELCGLTTAAYLESMTGDPGSGGLLPDDPAEIAALLELFSLDNLVREIARGDPDEPDRLRAALDHLNELLLPGQGAKPS